MNKETWLLLRNSGNIPIQIFYQFYQENDGKLEYRDFEHCFQLYINAGGDYKKMFRELDNKFNVLLIHSKTGEFIKFS